MEALASTMRLTVTCAAVCARNAVGARCSAASSASTRCRRSLSAPQAASRKDCRRSLGRSIARSNNSAARWWRKGANCLPESRWCGQRVEEPRPRHSPGADHGLFGDPQNAGDLRIVEAAEKAQFDNLGLARIELPQPRERLVDGENVSGGNSPRSEERRVGKEG